MSVMDRSVMDGEWRRRKARSLCVKERHVHGWVDATAGTEAAGTCEMLLAELRD